MVVILLLLSVTAAAQKEKETTDSARFYKKLQSFSDKRKFTKAIYKLIFRPVQYKQEEPAPQKEVKKEYYTLYEGKVIRNIYIDTKDPFGFKDEESMSAGQRFLERTGNYLHIKTFPLTVRNRLIIKKHDTFDSLRVRESMRLVRSENYIREIFLLPVLVDGTDSVDLFIRTYDVWSIIATGSASKTGFRINMKDKNFAGLGHQVQNDYSLNHTTGDYRNATDYVFLNIMKTYVNVSLHYDTDDRKNFNESLSLDRPFYSIFTKWAWGIYASQSFHRTLMYDTDSAAFDQNFRYNAQDYWLGKSWQLFKGQREDERTTSFISSARYYRVHYIEGPSRVADTMKQFVNEDFYLFGGGLIRRKYKQDVYIFKFGFTEDVPVGRALSLVGGYQIKDNADRWYAGAKMFWGNYYPWGYISSNMEYGTFIRSSSFTESCFTGGVNYFSPIFRLGRWKFRQFIKPQFTIGFNRLKTDVLSLNDQGIRGFNAVGVKGDQKLALSIQTQTYAPWNIIGFRFGPYLVCSFGMLGDESTGFRKSAVYSQFGLGMLIKNDFLVMSSFEISVAYYPYIPGVGNRIFKQNPFKTSDFGFRNSDVGKPSTVSYQ
jgi:hypothetical protein